MAHHSGRHTLSINGQVYERFKARCEALDISVSGTVEKLLADITGGPAPRNRPGPKPYVPRPPSAFSAQVPGAPAPHGTRSHYVRAKCRCEWCRAANNAYAKGTYPMSIEISEATHSMLRDRVVRELELRGVLVTPSDVADAAINRMLDVLEVHGMGAVT